MCVNLLVIFFGFEGERDRRRRTERKGRSGEEGRIRKKGNIDF